MARTMQQVSRATCAGRDVVVSTDVIQYDLGKTVSEGRFQRTAAPMKPPPELMTAVTKLRAAHEQKSTMIESHLISLPNDIPTNLSEMLARHPFMTQHTHQRLLQDLLYDSGYNHIERNEDCEHCDRSKLLRRPPRKDHDPLIHYGSIGSANTVMKHGKTRDWLARELGIICFEMEAAGMMQIFPCLVIRGICDYCDSHKNKEWQRYAAAAAAAYAKDLLTAIPKSELSGIATLQERREALLDSLKFAQMDSRLSTIKDAHSHTGEWLLQHQNYLAWKTPTIFADHHGLLWIMGKPGAGKPTLMKFAYTHTITPKLPNAAVVSFFFNARGDELEKSAIGMHRSLLLQVLKKMPDLQEVLDDEVLLGCLNLETEGIRNAFSKVLAHLGERRLTCFVDALDECDEQQVLEIVTYFKNLGQEALDTGMQLYLCFLSRHYPYIDIEHGRKLIVEDQPGHGKAMEEYVRSRLRVGQPAYIREIGTEILRKASGVFMWAVLVVDILNKEFKGSYICGKNKTSGDTAETQRALQRHHHERQRKHSGASALPAVDTVRRAPIEA